MSRLWQQRLLLSTALSVLTLPTLAQAMATGTLADDKVQEVVVTAAGYAQKIEKAPASISVLSDKEIKESRQQSLAEVLASVEGVDVGASAGKTGGLNISIRGMGSDYNLILVDGRRQNPAGLVTTINGFGETATSFMPPVSAIERIEVVRGPASTLYGSDALGGVINIITRKVGKTWTGSTTLDTTLQSDDAFGRINSGQVYLNGPLVRDLIGLSVYGRLQKREASGLSYEDANGKDVNITSFGKSPTESEIKSYGFRLNVTPHPDHDLSLFGDVSEQWYDNSKGQMGTNTAAGGYANALEFNHNELALKHDWRTGFGDLSTTLSRSTREKLGRIVPSGTANAGQPRTLESTNTIFETQLFKQIGAHSLFVGGQHWKAEMTDAVSPKPYKHTQWALYAEDTWALGETFNLTAGYRYDKHSVFGGQSSPRLYAVWNATPHWTVKGGISRGFKTPRLDQIAPGIVGFGGQGTIPILGTPSLKPETSTSTELAVFFDNRRDFRTSVTVFHNKFEDKIASGVPLRNCSFGLTATQYAAGQRNGAGCTDMGFFPRPETFGQSVNIDTARTQGIEVTARFQPATDWVLSGNYTFSDTEQTSGAQKGLPLNDTPEHMLNGLVRWTATDALNLWLRGEYRSRRYRAADTATSNAKATYGDYKAYGVFHLGGSYKLNDTLSVNATIYNLFDTDFVEYGPYLSDIKKGTVSYTNLYANNQEPRRLWVAVTATF
ncbi:MAG: TonB-dependent receptor domain-containing protein [Asticcacaulis sp.]